MFPSALAKRARAASLLFSVSSAAWTHLLAGSGGLAYGSLVPAPLYAPGSPACPPAFRWEDEAAGAGEGRCPLILPAALSLGFGRMPLLAAQRTPAAAAWLSALAGAFSGAARPAAVLVLRE